MEFTSALLTPIEKWTAELDLIELYCFKSYIYDIFAIWTSVSEESISYIFNKIPKLDSVLDRKLILSRIVSAQSHDEQKRLTNKELLPEIFNLYKGIFARISSIPVEPKLKAEAWLYSVAINYGGEADLEAVAYLASRGLPNVDAEDIRNRWYDSICENVLSHHKLSKIARSGTMALVDEETLKRAENRTITLRQAAEVLRTGHELSDFYFFRDEEQIAVQQAIVRCAEWLEIGGFEEWLKYFTNDLSNGPISGIEFESFFWLFLWCRSDHALEIADKQGLNAWVHALARSGEAPDKPWLRWSHNSQKKQESVDAAAIFAFTARRINPDKPLSATEINALSLLMQCQLANGAWSLYSDKDEASILSTCLAIHALAICEPKNWVGSAQRGAQWLLAEIKEKHHWEAKGIPIVLNTVLALDSVELAFGNKKVTFKAMSTESSEAEKIALRMAKLPIYDYSKQDWYNAAFPDTESVNFTLLSKDIEIDVVLMTATEIELIQTIKLMTPLDGQQTIIETVNDSETYYLGKFGAYDAALFKCRMGSDGSAGATLGGNSAIRLWNPLAVIMVGIAFGSSIEKYKPADVLISTEIIQYESQRVGEVIKFTGAIPPSGPKLVNRFENSIPWRFLRPDGEKVTRFTGKIFSGNKLIDNEEFKQRLLSTHAGMGGEMEGVGVWAAATRSGVEWILVKAVCDWADGVKTDMYQEMAAASAASLCHYVLSKHTTLDDLRRPF